MATPADNQKQIDSLLVQRDAVRDRLKDQNLPFRNDPEYLGLSQQITSLQNQINAAAPNNPATDVYEGIDRNSGQGVYVNSQTGERYTGPVKETPQTQVTTQANAENIAEATSKGPVGSVANTTVPGTGENNTLSQVNTATNPTAQPNAASSQPRGVDAPVNPSTDSALSAQQSATDSGGVPTETLASNFAVTDTGGVPTDSLTNIDGDTGFVPPGATTAAPEPIPNYTTSFNPETGNYDVYNLDTGQTVRTGLSEQQAILEAQDLSTGAAVGANALAYTPEPAEFPYNTAVEGSGDQQDPLEEGLDQEIVSDGQGGLTTVTRSAAQVQAEVETLRQAQALQQLRAKNTNEDWRLRIRLAPNASYLYRAASPGILQPLQGTNGVVFPYTPTISTSYRANYDAYELVHTNYKGYFYKNSSVQEITVNGIFTANSAAEADYMLAVIHFFRSASKMFYGQDSNPVAGTPPPVLYLDGLGVYQFNEHPCLLSAFNYSLPSDVDYIRAGGARNYSGGAVNLAGIRNQQGAASNSPLGATLSRLTSLKNTFDNFINPGARANNPVSQNTTNYYGIAGQPTYVPTKIDISITLLPLISRQQQAQVFSLKNYATGQGLREQGFF